MGVKVTEPRVRGLTLVGDRARDLPELRPVGIAAAAAHRGERHAQRDEGNRHDPSYHRDASRKMRDDFPGRPRYGVVAFLLNHRRMAESTTKRSGYAPLRPFRSLYDPDREGRLGIVHRSSRRPLPTRPGDRIEDGSRRPGKSAIIQRGVPRGKRRTTRRPSDDRIPLSKADPEICALRRNIGWPRWARFRFASALLLAAALIVAGAWMWRRVRPEWHLTEAGKLIDAGRPGEALEWLACPWRLPRPVTGRSADGTRGRAGGAAGRRGLAPAAARPGRAAGGRRGVLARACALCGRAGPASQPVVRTRAASRPDDPETLRWVAASAYDLGAGARPPPP